MVGVFSFIFPDILLKLPDAELEMQVSKFVKIYDNDISADFMRQILAFKACASAFIMNANNPNEILNILMKLDLCSCFPDLVTSYFILLTLPVSVASN